MPSSSQKCWDKKVRQFLHLKSLMLNVTVDNMLGLLPLLATSMAMITVTRFVLEHFKNNI